MNFAMRKWRFGLGVAVLTGGATAFAFGQMAANLTLKQLLFVFLATVSKDIILYLKNHPAPETASGSGA